jgi:hypothetical protein
MTESSEVVAVRGPSAWSGPCQLDRDAAWTTWREVNEGEPAPTHAGARGNRSLAPLGSVGDRLTGPGDGPEIHHLDPTNGPTDRANAHPTRATRCSVQRTRDRAMSRPRSSLAPPPTHERPRPSSVILQND